MQNRLAILFLFLWFQSPMPIPANEQTPPVSPSVRINQAIPENAQQDEPVEKETGQNATAQKQKKPSPTVQNEDNESVKIHSVSPAKSAETDATPTRDGLQPQSPPPPAVQDRRWIIRTPPPNSKKNRPAPVKPVKWKNDSQKKQCEAYIEGLSGVFLRARYYSIQGDSCACAENAGRFLSIREKIQAACPDHFLENEGYSERISRNMGWLKALGEKRCMGPKTGPEVKPKSTAGHHPADETAKKPHANTGGLTNPSGNQPERAAETPPNKSTATPR